MHRSPALQRPVVLGSTSRYRRELLQRLNLRFQVAAPAVDETPQPGEAPRALALRQVRGQAVAFQTAVAVVCAATGFEQLDLACVQVQFRALSDAEIERYLRAEQPY